MISGIRQFMIIVALACLALPALAQPVVNRSVNENLKEAKPYRVLTSGKSVTVKSTKDIKSIMVWTTDGHRVLEQRDINTSNYSFRITINAKIFFMRVELVDGKTYTERIGVQ